MENESSNKIRLLLNELAILNQPDLLDGKFIYQLDTLKRIKQLTAELYMLSDQSLFGSSSANATVHSHAEQITLQSDHQPQAEEKTEIETEKAPAVIHEEIKTVEEKIEAKIAEPAVEVVETIPKPETTTNNVAPPATKIPEVQPMAEQQSGKRGEEIAAKISLTRRFEYINNLFAGDSSAFIAFLSSFIDLPNMEVRMQHFDEVAAERNWRKKSESAQDLRNLLRKLP